MTEKNIHILDANGERLAAVTVSDLIGQRMEPTLADRAIEAVQDEFADDPNISVDFTG